MRSILMAMLVVGLGATGCTGLPSPAPLPPGQSFAGEWNSNWGMMRLQQSGSRVFGPFQGFREGSISGEQEGNLVVFTWRQLRSAQWGRGYLQMSPDGRSLEGKWGYQKNYTNGGRWTAQRVSQ